MANVRVDPTGSETGRVQTGGGGAFQAEEGAHLSSLWAAATAAALTCAESNQQLLFSKNNKGVESLQKTG